MIKSIAVHLTGSEEDEVRLAYAAALAGAFGAHLTGLLAWPLPDIPTFIDSRQAASQAAAALRLRLSRIEAPSELRSIEGPRSQIGNLLARQARLSDLFIGTRPYGSVKSDWHVEEAVLLGLGRGCFFVPPQGTPPASYRSILVAWDNSPASAHAVGEALPFLQRAEKVHVAVIADEAEEQDGEQPAAGIVPMLRRHGVRAEVGVVSSAASAGEAIEKDARTLLCDMIVMGGYDRSPLRERLLGGPTHLLLERATVPVLMAH